jgi:hypothetical protein
VGEKKQNSQEDVGGLVVGWNERGLGLLVLCKGKQWSSAAGFDVNAGRKLSRNIKQAILRWPSSMRPRVQVYAQV